jgi:ribonuclease P protein component
MKKIEIIKKNTDFSKIISEKNNLKNNYFSIYYKKNNQLKNNYGISVPTKTGNAVVRNKIKRQIKNIIDKNSIPIGYDYVIIIKRGLLEGSFSEIEDSLINLLNRTGETNEK